jgi:thiamine-phosphate pyrophosphorylase
MTQQPFLLVVITSPESFPGEVDHLEGLLEAGLEKLHIRKPGDGREVLLELLAPRWRTRLVVHGGRDVVELAKRYGVPQVHGRWHHPWRGDERIALSASLHSWKEVEEAPPGKLEYVFLSPVFDSISKPGYLAGEGLLRRPAGVAPCRVIGLGGIDVHTIGQVVEHGWDGAAVLGAIWQRREKAIERFRALKEIISHHGR